MNALQHLAVPLQLPAELQGRVGGQDLRADEEAVTFEPDPSCPSEPEA